MDGEGVGGGRMESLVLVRKDLAEEVTPRPNYGECGFRPEENE